MEGVTPIEASLSLGKDVSTLYVLSENGLEEYEAGNLNLTIGTAATKSRGISTAAVEQTAIDQAKAAFPAKSYNVASTDIYKNSDIHVTEDAEFTISFVSYTGGDGILRMYTYDASIENPTIDDCTFYAVNEYEPGYMKATQIKGQDGEFFEVGKGEAGRIKLSEFGGDEKQNHIFDPVYSFGNVPFIYTCKGKRNNSKDYRYTFTVPAGKKIGFTYLGWNNGMHDVFTTPSLNTEGYEKYKNTWYQDGGEYIKAPFANGIIKKFGGKYFALGMENSYPVVDAFDGSYNDMICLIELNSGKAEPTEKVNDVELKSKTVMNGFYLFEDNYPDIGDYDFNDVVIRYRITTDLTKAVDDPMRNSVEVVLLAYGCGLVNEFGFHVGDINDKTEANFHPIFKNIQGYVNVDKNNTGEKVDPSKFRYPEQTIYYFAGKVTHKNYPGEAGGAPLRPYLRNEKSMNDSKSICGAIYSTSFTTGQKYPYVLDVPFYSSSYNYTINDRVPENDIYNFYTKYGFFDFRWCKEGEKLTDAYKDDPSVKGWYKNGFKDDSLLITLQTTE